MTDELIFYGDEYRSDRPDWPFHVSSGGVVFRVRNKQLEILLLKNSNRGYTSYHLPKGTVKLNESLEAAATREIAEEAGVNVSLMGYLGAQMRPAAKSRDPGTKTVHFFAARFENYTGSNDGSYHGIIWVSPRRAIELLGKIKVKREDVFVKRLIELVQLMKTS